MGIIEINKMSDDLKVEDEPIEHMPSIEEKFNSPKRRKKGVRNRGYEDDGAAPADSCRPANG